MKKMDPKKIAAGIIGLLLLLMIVFPQWFWGAVNKGAEAVGLVPPFETPEDLREYSMIMMLIMALVLFSFVFFSWGFWALVGAMVLGIIVAFVIRSLFNSGRGGGGISGNTSINTNV